MKSNSAERIAKILEYYGITQSEFAKRTGIPRSTVNMYLKGERNPKQDKLSDIADAFNINEGWVMGYDVPMKRGEKSKDFDPLLPLSDLERKVIEELRKADDLSQSMVLRILGIEKEGTVPHAMGA